MDDIPEVLKTAIKRCQPALDRKLQEVTRDGATPWPVIGDADAIAQALSALIEATSHEAPEGSEIIVALSAPNQTVTVSAFAAGARCGLPKVLSIGPIPRET